ncbi:MULTISPECIES: SDR family oxidoreductase [Mycobacteriaceae]|uniref:SDR family oxidoreductase n=1 Tax=Mycobacteriaceae TaxID=1762 RepID=UPI0007495F71|nr:MULTISPECIES: SDR family oxidoreductase [Mycolicibacterium]KUH64583.1 short-chain dehydrogenase [Mycolicibacterium novocastrense]KUH64719.1 short-chain dehydrogenase [Mycolicibacterium novocastrense]KUH76861.1 short-chain dehydrogenase [Mycolicibacterium novocastrense]CRL77726.1 short-chain alcohol dehydrogenase [Mycolicibacterium malmesburyense]
MGELSLAGKRVVVVGASAGIGRSFAVRAGKDGAEVVLAARRVDKLDEVVAEAGRGVTVAVDVRNPADCARLAEVAGEALGKVDILLISSGYAPLKMFSDTGAEDWRDVFETNVIGVHELIRAHLPILDPTAIVAALSSDSVRHPHTALGAYSSSKAAMERCLVSWRLEKPGYRFSCVEISGTVPTDFTSQFDPDLLGTALTEWLARGLVQESRMTPDAVADVLAGTFASAIDNPDVGLESLVLKSPTGPMRS